MRYIYGVGCEVYRLRAGTRHSLSRFQICAGSTREKLELVVKLCVQQPKSDCSGNEAIAPEITCGSRDNGTRT